MKKVLMAVVAMAVVLGGLMQLFGSQPTLTQTTSFPGKLHYYKYTFSSNSANADSAILYKDNDSRAFDLRYMLHGANTDSAITLIFNTTETSPDSVRWTLQHQISFDGSTWTTWQTDVLDSALVFVKTFMPHRYGRPYWYRPLLRENNTSKDASQDITVELVFPEPR